MDGQAKCFPASGDYAAFKAQAAIKSGPQVIGLFEIHRDRVYGRATYQAAIHCAGLFSANDVVYLVEGHSSKESPPQFKRDFKNKVLGLENSALYSKTDQMLAAMTQAITQADELTPALRQQMHAYYSSGIEGRNIEWLAAIKQQVSNGKSVVFHGGYLHASCPYAATFVAELKALGATLSMPRFTWERGDNQLTKADWLEYEFNLHKATQRMEEGNFAAATIYLDRIEAVVPSDTLIFTARAHMQAKQGDFESALKTADRGLAFDHSQIALLEMKGPLLRKLIIGDIQDIRTQDDVVRLNGRLGALKATFQKLETETGEKYNQQSYFDLNHKATTAIKVFESRHKKRF